MIDLWILLDSFFLVVLIILILGGAIAVEGLLIKIYYKFQGFLHGRERLKKALEDYNVRGERKEEPKTEYVEGYEGPRGFSS